MIGWNEFGQSVISHLIGAGRKVAVVTRTGRASTSFANITPTEQVYTLFSDYNNFDLLEKANIKRHLLFPSILMTTPKSWCTSSILKDITSLSISCVTAHDNGNLKATFQNYSVKSIMLISKNEISSRELLASHIFAGPDVALFSEEIIAFAYEQDRTRCRTVLCRERQSFESVLDTGHDSSIKKAVQRDTDRHCRN